MSFGDVWFCSGQSNMGWAMKGSSVFKNNIFQDAQFSNYYPTTAGIKENIG